VYIFRASQFYENKIIWKIIWEIDYMCQMILIFTTIREEGLKLLFSKI
jgi:hypothetical protein